MSVENFDGNGLADQPSLIYGYTDDQDELHIKELSRSGYGEPGPSPGDVIDRKTTKSTLDDGLPALPIPGQDGLQYDDCGEDIPAFACEDCGSPIYVGRTCANPLCSRDWAAAVKSKVDTPDRSESAGVVRISEDGPCGIPVAVRDLLDIKGRKAYLQIKDTPVARLDDGGDS